jgi:hypothetical protein
MTGFEFLFSFYGLLLGLAVAQVTSGFADTWRHRGNWRIGVVPPLLGLFILLAVAQQWDSFWSGRDALDMGPWQLLTSMGMALPFIFLSHAMFPVALGGGGSLEDHYFQQRHILLGALLVPPVVSLAYNIGMSPPQPALDYLWLIGLGQGPRWIIPVALMIWPQRWVHVTGISLLCLWMLFLLFV